MMIAKSCSIVGASALLSLATLLGFAPSAAGQADAPERAGAGAPERAEPTPPGKLAPKLVARLEQLEQARRALRKAAQQDPKAWAEGRSARAKAHQEEIARLWGSVVGTIDAQAHLRLHAERMARLNRLLDLAEVQSNKSLVARVRADITRELVRHAQSMHGMSAGAE
jgi:hypothetical protein